MNTFKKTVGYLGLVLSVSVCVGTLGMLFLAPSPPKEAVRFEGFAADNTSMVMRNGSLELTEGGSLSTNQPLVWQLRNMVLGTYFVFTLLASVLLLRQSTSSLK
ncbi:MAG: hypothetical protein KME45_07125 [Stenomitos rutilans HA7619-LM2]|jgi:hypothetical protein|nr:hypothetical protein [Stenomitos rutilans HA7619-LM2]